MIHYCLYCFEQIGQPLSWEKLLIVKERKYLCANCSGQLVEITNNYCEYCYKQSDMERCSDCLKWSNYYGGQDPLQKNISIFEYNDTMKEMITKWKYRGDFAVGKFFAYKINEVLAREFQHLQKEEFSVVPIPLSTERLYERAFNQAEQLTSQISTIVDHSFLRIHTEKQSKMTRYERLNTMNPFKLKNKPKKNVVLVDDIYTTGQTVRHAASLLKRKGCNNIYALTLVRG